MPRLGMAALALTSLGMFLATLVVLSLILVSYVDVASRTVMKGYNHDTYTYEKAVVQERQLSSRPGSSSGDTQKPSADSSVPKD